VAAGAGLRARPVGSRRRPPAARPRRRGAGGRPATVAGAGSRRAGGRFGCRAGPRRRAAGAPAGRRPAGGEPRRAARSAAGRRRPPSPAADRGRGGAGLPLPRRPRSGHHRLERQEHHHRPDRCPARGLRLRGRGVRQHRPATRGLRCRPPRPPVRDRAVELPAGGGEPLPAARRCSTSVPTTSTDTPMSASTPPPRGRSSRASAVATWRCSTPTTHCWRSWR
jgi:hypothetical protein